MILYGTRKSTGGKVPLALMGPLGALLPKKTGRATPSLMGLGATSFGRIKRPGLQPALLRGALGESSMMEWLKTQNPLVMGVTVLGLSIATGLVVSTAAVWTLNKLK